MNGTLAAEDLELLRKDFSANPAYRLAQNAVTRVSVDDVAINREIVNSTDHSQSTLLDDWKVTNQEHSGRCWLFAGLNLLRVGAMKKMGLKDFEFSQNYAMFWDKIERANYFLEAIIETADRDVDDRTVAHLLDSRGRRRRPVEHVRRHRRQARPGAEVGHAGDAELVQHRPDELGAAQPAAPGRQVAARGSRAGVQDAARAEKAEVLRVVYRVLCIHLGTPPERFDWQWTDKDKEFHRDGDAHPAGVRRQVRGAAARRLRLPRARPARVEPDRPDVHRRVPRQRARARRRSPTSTSTCR